MFRPLKSTSTASVFFVEQVFSEISHCAETTISTSSRTDYFCVLYCRNLIEYRLMHCWGVFPGHTHTRPSLQLS